MVYFLPAGLFLAGALFGHWLTFRLSANWVLLIAAVVGAISATLLLSAQQAEGAAGIGAAVASILLLAPVGVGLLIGSAIARFRQRRRARKHD